jgi:hypothetical protein
MGKLLAPQNERSPRLLIVELNEFDPVYLARVASAQGLEHLQQVLAFAHSTTATDDRIEHQGLDPWVQWVGIHCGKPTDAHGIRRLGATRVQTLPQIWHAVANQGYTWGVWGAMNAPLGDPRGCQYFMPDPWSFEECAYPPYLNDLLALPRYAARNYLEIDRKKAFAAALRFARFFAPPSHWNLLLRFSTRALRAAASTGVNVHTFTTLFDYLSVLCFVKLRRDRRPNLSMIFLNHVAHLQHQFWFRGDRLHPEMKLGLELCNAMFGLLLADRQKDEAFLLMNGLKQKNVEQEGFYVYRQRNPQHAVEAIGVIGGRVEQNMTHDATVIFSDSRNADRAVELLDRCRLSDGHKAFYVERQGADRVFYQLAFEHDVRPETAIVCGNYSQPFYDAFQLICERTGAHVPEGDVYHDAIDIPEQLKNHEIFDHVLQFFQGKAAVPVMMDAVAQLHDRMSGSPKSLQLHTQATEQALRSNMK